MAPPTRGMPHKFYHGHTSRVWNITKCAIDIKINKHALGRTRERPSSPAAPLWTPPYGGESPPLPRASSTTMCPQPRLAYDCDLHHSKPPTWSAVTAPTSLPRLRSPHREFIPTVLRSTFPPLRSSASTFTTALHLITQLRPQPCLPTHDLFSLSNNQQRPAIHSNSHRLLLPPLPLFLLLTTTPHQPPAVLATTTTAANRHLDRRPHFFPAPIAPPSHPPALQHLPPHPPRHSQQ